MIPYSALSVINIAIYNSQPSAVCIIFLLLHQIPFKMVLILLLIARDSYSSSRMIDQVDSETKNTCLISKLLDLIF